MEGDGKARWYVMRDLKRANAKQPAYRLLEEKNVEVFVPKVWRLSIRGGRHVREEAPFIRDLLFVHDTRGNLDSIVEKTPTLQFRWLRGTYRKPMTVSDIEMERFIRAASSSENPRYYLPGEVTPQMCGRRVRIVGGPFDGYEGLLLMTRGARVRRLLVELRDFLAVGVEVSPEYIHLL